MTVNPGTTLVARRCSGFYQARPARVTIPPLIAIIVLLFMYYMLVHVCHGLGSLCVANAYFVWQGFQTLLLEPGKWQLKRVVTIAVVLFMFASNCVGIASLMLRSLPFNHSTGARS